jgi:hypothetical protein
MLGFGAKTKVDDVTSTTPANTKLVCLKFMGVPQIGFLLSRGGSES